MDDWTSDDFINCTIDSINRKIVNRKIVNLFVVVGFVTKNGHCAVYLLNGH